MNHKEELLNSRIVHQGKVISLRLDTYKIGDHTKVYEIIHHPGAVVLIPIDSKGRLLLVRQWRRAIQRYALELPAGTLDISGEDPLHCAQRELREETGFRAEKLTSLKGFYCTPGFCDEYLHLFLAEDLIHDPLPQDDDEDIELITMELPAALHAIEEGEIFDAKSIVGILRYQLWKKKQHESSSRDKS